MIQTGLIQPAHNDLVTDASYDFYGLRLATCSVDQRIKVWRMNEQSGSWEAEDDWKAHDATVARLSWAHPEFGSVLASASYDRTVKVWEQVSAGGIQAMSGANVSTTSSRWVERAMLTEARGTVRAVEFAPHHFGLKLATISTDNVLRIYECLEQPTLTNWQLSEEVDMFILPSTTLSPGGASRAHTMAVATPTQTNATFDAANASLVTQALQQQNLQQGGSNSSMNQKPGMGAREADGGWCISWCKDRYWGEVIAVGCGVNGVVKLIQLSPSRRPATVAVLDPSPVTQKTLTVPGTPNPDPSHPTPSAITSVSWAPSLGRSYHLIATGGRDGHVRIYKVKPVDEGTDDEDSDEGRWSYTLVADFDQHRSTVSRVEWNITGTVLSSSGNDGRIRLWKATSGGNVWRTAGSVGVEQAEEREDEDQRKEDDRDVDMTA